MDTEERAQIIVEGGDIDEALAGLGEAKAPGKANPPAWLASKNMEHWRQFLDDNPEFIGAEWPDTIRAFKNWADDRGIRIDSQKGGSRIAQQ